jgi:hypothetical protein
MNHDEMLTEIVAIGTGDNPADLIDILGAVLDLHVVAKFNGGRNHGLNRRCTECGFAYPCPTIEAIEKGLE